MNKKIIFTLFACFALFLSSCEKDNSMPDIPPLQILSGEWIVSGDPYMEDEGWTLTTSNTNDNAPDKLLLTDKESFWHFVVAVPADPWKAAFGQNTPTDNLDYDEIGVIIKNGKITPQAVTLPSGFKADKISFTLAFEDDDYEEWRIVGYRKSGFLEDVGYIYYEE